MRVEWTEDLVVKVAESEKEAVRLGHEQVVLRAVAHPAIVRVATSDAGEHGADLARLCLHRVTGGSLADVVDQPEEIIAGWGAAVATVVADLHDLGYTHGAIAAEHVLVDEQGRPILCGFGQAGRIEDVGGDAVGEDIRSVARLIEKLLPPSGGRLGRTVSRWADGRHHRRSSARALAQAIVERVPDAAVMPVRRRGDESPAACEDGDWREAPGGSAGRGGLAGGSTGRGGVAGGSSGRRGVAGESGRDGARIATAVGFRRHRARSGLAGPGRGRTLMAGAVLVTITGIACGLVALERARPVARATAAAAPLSAYLVKSMPGEQAITVVGSWSCGPPRPAVLDIRSGSIWTFPSWPSRGGAITGAFVRRVPGASGLAAVSDRKGCDTLLVLRPGQPDLAMSVGTGRR